MRPYTAILRETCLRLLLVLAGFVLSAVAIEVTLQVAAVVARATMRPVGADWVATSAHLVCLGDSNTYGLYVGTDHAYPREVERTWNAQPGRRQLAVSNLGYPGTTSSALRNRLGGILATQHPYIVTLMVGANDGWLLPEAVRDDGTAPNPGLWTYSRLYRLLRLMWLTDGGTQPVEADPGPVLHPTAAPKTGIRGWDQQLARNLEVLIDRIRQAGALPILLTYPSHTSLYGEANAIIRATASARGIPLIDVNAAFEAQCGAQGCPELFLPDQHPTAAGYVLAARTIVDGLASFIDGRMPAPTESPGTGGRRSGRSREAPVALVGCPRPSAYEGGPSHRIARQPCSAEGTGPLGRARTTRPGAGGTAPTSGTIRTV